MRFKKTSALVVAATLVAALPAMAETTLDEVLAAHFETIGGEDAWRKIETVKMTGTMHMIMMGVEAPVTMWFKSPNMTRMEIILQGMTIIRAYDGETAWSVMPLMGQTEPEPEPAEMAEDMSEQADVNPFLDWKNKGYELEYVGTEEVDGTEAHKIKLTWPSGNVRYYYLDTDYYLPFRVEGKTDFQGQEVDSLTTLGDYKEVGDLIFAHSIESRQGGVEAPGQVLTFDSIEVDIEIPASKFDMNAEMPAAPAESGS